VVHFRQVLGFALALVCKRREGLFFSLNKLINLRFVWVNMADTYIRSELQYNSVTPRMSGSVVYNGMVFLSGQVGNPAEDGDSVAKQTATCLRKIEALLTEAGSGLDNMLKCEIWLTDMKYFAEMNAVYDPWVAQARAPPARACGQSMLARPDLLVEVICIAAVATAPK
jgi:enamine deaminase RidA (YjgF/YER057c/UK114 family)